MPPMPRPRPLYVHREKTRHGKMVWYFRRDGGPRIRLKGEYGSEEFRASYLAALNGEEAKAKPKASSGTLKWLVSRYEESAPFLALAPSTQRMRSNVLKAVCKTGGDLRISSIDRKTIAEGRDRRAKTPFAAITFLKTMSQLFDWAVDAGLAVENPAKDVKRPTARTEGFTPWADRDIIAFCEFHKVGTRPRLAMDLMLFTGLARADAIQIGKQHIREGVIEFRRTKTSAPLYIAVHPSLAASIAAAETGDLAILVTSRGQPWGSAASFGNTFSEWCREANLSVRAHGLRKRIATIMAEGGGTTSQLKAYFGWGSDGMASHYTRRADARALALAAAGKLNGNILSPHLELGAGTSENSPTISKAEK